MNASEQLITASAVQQLAAYLPEGLSATEAAAELARLAHAFESERRRLSEDYGELHKSELQKAYADGIMEGERRQIRKETGHEPVNPIGLSLPVPF